MVESDPGCGNVRFITKSTAFAVQKWTQSYRGYVYRGHVYRGHVYRGQIYRGHVYRGQKPAGTCLQGTET